MSLRSALRRPRTWLIGIPILVVLVAVVGPFVYINVIQDDPPERLTFASATGTTLPEDDTSTTAAPAASADDARVEGTWAVADGSIAGYRVKEILFGQDTEAVGRTSEVTGELQIEGTTVQAATFTVDMTSVRSDQDRRDGQFHGRIMDTRTHPTATFELTEPIALDALPADGEEVSVVATGEFTIRGVTNTETFELLARRNGAAIEVNGTIPVAFADYDIPDASFGPASVADNGEIEFLLVFNRS